MWIVAVAGLVVIGVVAVVAYLVSRRDPRGIDAFISEAQRRGHYDKGTADALRRNIRRR